MITFDDIKRARKRIQKQIYLSPLAYSETISRMSGHRVFFKLENLQMTGSFKERGALNRLLTLPPGKFTRGVIAASAGNHGMALAFHSQRLNIPATIVMPVHAPLIKVSRVRQYGGECILHGADYDSAFAEAHKLSRLQGRTFVHAFDDPWVIAGQGTIGLELYEQNPALDTVVVPVGGGGLIGGIALALTRLKPRIRIIGVQAEVMPSMRAALETGKPVRHAAATTIADGIAVRMVGELPFRLVRQYVDEIVTVTEAEIANAVLLLLEIEKTVAEGAAAVSLAAILNKKVAITGKTVGLVVSGGNIDMNLISRIIEKGLIQDGRLARFSVITPDQPGTLAQLAQRIARTGANILHISQSRGFGQMAIGETEIEFTLETTGLKHVEEIYQRLDKDHFRIKKET